MNLVPWWPELRVALYARNDSLPIGGDEAEIMSTNGRESILFRVR